MAQIIALHGTGNSGKTTSIKKVLGLLEVTYPAAKRVKIIREGVEIIIVVEIGGIVIILASGGDTEEILRRLFAEIAEIGWDILLCATKSYGKTVKFIEQKRLEHKIIWIEKAWQHNPAERERENTTTAKEIVRQIEEVYPAL